ncbi:MAG TPA: thiamine pyrophosphate-dependent dehydrogenase E1 component subunit alpha [Thermoanaerobaculia bacterium]|jgi:pyruvate dehydrogenase E1 component alpha subunit/2-oxoisovalerate dehydrogenase E1 component alpha subunit|nr:thiamine pyrophosphate-dependent dehydrogenase E1 component subunit alpha [Thermoanaerobaculia bacterium]
MTDVLTSTNTHGLSNEQLLEIDYFLRLTRTLEERLVALFRQAKVIGGLYRSLGQEGESVAAAYALDYSQGDVVQPLIRNIGSILVAGAKPADIIKQYMAKGDGPTRGRELNIHFGHPARDGFIGQISMLGDMIPVMAGIALAGRMQKRNLVTLAFIGDGGSSTGAFWEGMNFAAVQKLPMVVIVEDNGYAYSTPTSKQTAARTLADKSVALGCRGVTVDGNDVLAVYGETKLAIDRARGGGGVTLIEVKTFRMKGHAEHDNQAYVPPELIEEWKAKDPLARFERVLMELGTATQADFTAIQERVRREVDAATDEAERSPMPDPADAGRGLYIEDGYWGNDGR